jgi:hypothetical protein
MSKKSMKMKSADIKLKGCPLCGQVPSFVSKSSKQCKACGNWYAFECRNTYCAFHRTKWYNTEAKLIERWQDRNMCTNV